MNLAEKEKRKQIQIFLFILQKLIEKKQQATSSVRKLKVLKNFGLTLNRKIWEAILLTKNGHWIQKWRTHSEIQNNLMIFSWEKDASRTPLAWNFGVIDFPTLFSFWEVKN